ncbi:MAG TPA: HAMP domain-containing protein [Flavobacteriales bacterium]|nr:HAMP domain-containing protein [Flavobacteriales bacterium]HIN39349.1 HAMP domain-containing protein [Flavobacteriales bacterium]
MAFKFTIGKKIGSGFGVLLFLTLIVFGLTYKTLYESRNINNQINEVNNPSLAMLKDLNLLIEKSKMLILRWTSIELTDDPDKQRLRDLINIEYPEQKGKIWELAKKSWEPDEYADIKDVFDRIESLFILHQDVMEQLNSMESYEDPMVVFMINPMVEGGEVEEQSNKILENLAVLIEYHKENTHEVSDQMMGSFDDLEFVVRYLGIALLIGGILIAMFTVRSIVRPVQELKKLLTLLGKGIIPEKRINITEDEIGDMSRAMKDLVDGFKRTTNFAREVGSGNFQSEYKPLSKDDTLGYALLTMREDLHESEKQLERKVEERTQEVVRQKEEIELKNSEITSSIRYARRIQESILPAKEQVDKTLKDHFILYKPKDIVSGDFYWVGKANGKALVAAVDCTGHGVPGAFMSLIGNALLKESIMEHGKSKPADILNELNKLAAETMNQTFEESQVKDGMDIALCSIDFDTLEVEFSGAYNPLYIIRKRVGDNISDSTKKLVEHDNIVLKENENGCDLIEVAADKFPIGVFMGEKLKSFMNHELKLEKGDTIYIFSDGYVDQFGGSNGRKFMARRLRPLLLAIQGMSMKQQNSHLDKVIETWKKPVNGKEVFDQIDDILLIGIRL